MQEERYKGALGEAIEFIESLADPVITFNFLMSIFSLFLNLFHLLILTRKSVSSTSTNTILIGIAMSDIFTLFLTIEKYFTLVDIESNECISSNSLVKVYIDMMAWSLQDYFRRCSTWLGLSLAAVRTLIVKSLTSNSCEEFQNIYNTPKYTLDLTDLFEQDNQTIGNAYLMVDAVISKFAPCTCFPIFTVILISHLRNAKITKPEGSSSTTRLVIIMTIGFFISELSLGIIFMIRAFNHTHDGLIIASVDVIIVFTCLLTINSTFHFFFCMSLSRQYRKTFLGFFGIDKIVWNSPGSKCQQTRRITGTRNQSTVFESGIYLGNVSVK